MDKKATLRETKRVIGTLTAEEQAEAVKGIPSDILVNEILTRILNAEKKLEYIDRIRNAEL